MALSLQLQPCSSGTVEISFGENRHTLTAMDLTSAGAESSATYLQGYAITRGQSNSVTRKQRQEG